MSAPWTPPVLALFDPELEARLRALVDGKAKPPGALGRLEELAVQVGLIQGRADPQVDRATVLVFAGDHGLNAEGVSPYPSAVTAAMVGLFLSGRASVNAFAAAVRADVRVVDVGVAADLPRHPSLIAAKVRAGTRNAVREPAMTEAECAAALQVGFDAAQAAVRDGAEALALGEMGIGNTAAASLVLHRLAPAPLADCVGAGAGHDAAGMVRKAAVLARAAARATRPSRSRCCASSAATRSPPSPGRRWALRPCARRWWSTASSPAPACWRPCGWPRSSQPIAFSRTARPSAATP